MPGGIPLLADQSIVSRKIALINGSSSVATDETTTSTTYTDLATSGPSITLSPGVTQTNYLFTNYAYYEVGGTARAGYGSVAIAGAAALDTDATGVNSVSSQLKGAGRSIVASAHASGSADTMKWRVDAGTGHFANRRMTGFSA